MNQCLGAHGIDGLSRLSELLRPYLDLRGFYFGARSALFRECVPEEKGETVYLQLREIAIEKKGDVCSVEFNPLRKQRVSLISYVGDMRSNLLSPLKNPCKGGEHQLGGYFSKHSYCAIIHTLTDVINLTTAAPDGVEFKPIPLNCQEHFSGTLKRDSEEHKGMQKYSYKLFAKDRWGAESQLEMISFYLGKK